MRDSSSRPSREDSRPKISIRFRLILAFFLIFALCAGISVWIIYSQAAVQHKIRFLEIADGYMREIQQVRRYEKNYLLYKTNLQDAISHLHQAQKTIEDNHDHLTRVIAQEHFESVPRAVADGGNDATGQDLISGIEYDTPDFALFNKNVHNPVFEAHLPS